MKSLIVLSLLSLVGCVSFNADYAANASLRKEPVEGRLLTARVGDAVAQSGSYRTTSAILVQADVKTGLAGENRIHVGYYVKQGEDAESEYFIPEHSQTGGKVTRFPLADPIRGLQAYKGQQKLCTVTVFKLRECSDRATFARVNRPVFVTGTAAKDIVFAGLQGDVLVFSYSSSVGIGVGPFAERQVSYDLGKATVLAINGMAIDIIEAGANTIKYRIIP
jgi:hypothetical protein